jgi:parvulin-like peptidyl-prolyl isomerase
VGAGCDAVSPYAAKVNGVRISIETLNRELDAIRDNPKYLKAVEQDLATQGRKALGAGKGTFDSSFVSQVLTRRIFFELVHQEVRRRKLEITPEARRQARESLVESFGDEDMLQRFPDDFVDDLVLKTAEVDRLRGVLRGEVTDEQVRAFYDENPQFFDQFCVRVIVTGPFESLEVPPELEAQAKAAAEDAKRRVDTGQDFAAIARAESKDPQTAAAGGDFGCRTGEAFPPEVASSLTEAQVGEVRGPIRTDSGYFVVQLLERKKVPLEEAAPQIRSFLEGQAQDSFDAFLQDAVQKADITVNPRYGSFDKNGPAVVPPQAPARTTSGPPPSNRQ